MPTVLVVLVVLTIFTGWLLRQGRMDSSRVLREIHLHQAFYLAESGLAWALYRHGEATPRGETGEREGFEPLDSIPRLEGDTRFGFAGKAEFFDSLDAPRFYLDSGLSAPKVETREAHGFLEVRSAGFFRAESTVLEAVFGLALDPRLFGAALTLDNTEPLEPYPPESIVGQVRARKAGKEAGGVDTAWPADLKPMELAQAFAEKRLEALSALLRRDLVREGGEPGNGYFGPGDEPLFAADSVLFFPFGDVEIRGGLQEPLRIRGPGRISAHGDIRVRGLVSLENVDLLAGRDIVLEDSVAAQGLGLYAGRNITIADRCSLQVQAVGAGIVRLRGAARTDPRSLLLSGGGVASGEQGTGLSVDGGAVARGFLVAAGAGAAVRLVSPGARVEGVVLSTGSAHLEGPVYGAVAARSLACDPGGKRNCLGRGRIDRTRMPPDVVQPVGLVEERRRASDFRLLEWRIIR